MRHMINYYFIEYFRKIEGLSMQQLSEVCGKTGSNAKNYYSKSLSRHREMPSESVQAIAEALDIAPGWITQSPIITSKEDLDRYINQHIRASEFKLIGRLKNSNQYSIDSYDVVNLLNDFSDKLNNIYNDSFWVQTAKKNNERLNEYINLIKHSFLPDPDYTPMPMRTMYDYALSHYDNIPAFVHDFAKHYPDYFKRSRTEGLIRDLITARSTPEITVEHKVFEHFADFTNSTLDQVMCDFRLSSNESVFNLFLATSLTISDWVVTGIDDFTLTLTNPLYKPSAANPQPTIYTAGY